AVVAADDGLVDLHAAGELVAFAAVQHVAKLEGPQARGLVVHADLALELLGVGAILFRHQQVEQQKQLVQLKLCHVQKRTSRGAGLVAAGSTLDQTSVGVAPALAMGAARAGKAVRPACGDEGVKAVVLCAVQSHEFDQVGGNRQGKRRGSRRGLGISRVQGSSSFTFHGVLQKDAIKLTWAATKPDAGGHAISMKTTFVAFVLLMCSLATGAHGLGATSFEGLSTAY